MARIAPFRVRLWDIDPTDRGRGDQVAFIDDAKDIGVSAYANEAGEMFFTLPMNHPQITQIEPWQRHYEVSRLDISTGLHSVIGVGIVDDFDAVEDEVIVYGRDYLSLFDASISGAQASYTNETYTDIITNELSAAIFQPGRTDLSVSRFISLGTISSVSETTTVLTSYQSRLEFIRQLGGILASDDSTRPIIRVSRTEPFTVTWGANVGSDQNGVRLEYGGSINGFRFNPDFSSFATDIYSIGQKREGAALLFGHEIYASPASYGIIQAATVFLDVVNQDALDRRTRRFARTLGTTNRNLGLSIRSGGLAPVSGWDIADSVRVVVNRGIVTIDDLYTVWGWEWTGRKNGSEELFLDLLPKQT